ncbi:MAG: type I glyceraldehyde-3-phosphate dehydrogenase [Candidatus Doudnabacteria bacterium RIFCSPLOWO2_01_FULL_48_57]|uniref:Type I glyceraldehyde-3-phosphate dehydrogenase n=1 Tax=Candidatus Doudnabacteria bacterium RIFCSPLOWO2_02_FULL_48_13 TaxID=1817845 RepID=A0A1F5Q8R5_9BACT|nr:MAG: type I glyceraldehyde-3-phosphate dehydrogenase [Candidatus Doudnabacteria bacterium RIFCSPHIGHO2_01_48_18]OGE77060.1 MAG: type I glyceraldehyde-3-phosphate dehydrogenase [Candidatus Doudnabacteria bacterium RIFCSPHIGHO2_01_FULL_48_180]OGE90988.1 MAG: type I glyceraldehyde-3-phosphate dehydrogenase [Candidatus Doudnabacteria bacterium RIFCSPHIGHO2_12_FULL_47_25]OGE96350.1 MAG: type I glyceraldehyde-3-phosphate dehydrogenase [Candidatus Doudnabacteria bacterium RIFCSPLOWO2_01_FULL_48_57]
MHKPIKLAINGLGRIGRVFLRIAWDNPHFDIIAANSRSDIETYAHLLKYDSTYGVWDKDVKAEDDKLIIDGKVIPFHQEVDGEDLPWGQLGAELVLDATGKFKNRAEAESHIKAGAKYVVVTAPGHDLEATLVYGVNHEIFDPQNHKIISGASCTSICTSLVVKVLEDSFGIERGFINTVHAFTSDQSLQDSSHKDLRRARAATQSIIPTSTGVTKTVGNLFPSLAGKISGISLRVPVIDPSILAFSVQLKTSVTAGEVNQAFRKAAADELKGHLAVSDLPLVSRDYQSSPYGATIDALSTEVVDGSFVNVLAWYDNEWGYVSQLTNLLEYLSQEIKK